MKRLKRILSLILLTALLLSLPCHAERMAPDYDFTGKTLDEIIAEYMAAHGLTEDNFSMGWYNTGTGEIWYYNADLYMPAGSIYKLPLNMEMEKRLDDGSLSPDDFIEDYQVEQAMYLSIVASHNEISQSLRHYLSGDRDTYRNLLNQFSGIPESELPPGYYSDNLMSPRFVLNTLIHLYENRESFDIVIDLMKQAHPKAYFREYQGEYEIAHKYGSYEGMLNDCGIVFTPTPFLLVAFTKSIPDNRHALGSLCELMTAYSLYLDEQAALAAEEAERLAAEEAQRLAEEQALREAEEAARPEPQSTPDPDLAVTPTPTEASQTGVSALRLIGTAAVCLLFLAAGAYVSLRRKKGKH